MEDETDISPETKLESQPESQDPFDYDPPEVKWVPIKSIITKVLPTGEHVNEEKVTGFHVVPPFGLTWKPLQTLRHFAALIEHRTGQRVRVAPKLKHVRTDDDEYDVEEYEVHTEHVAGQAASYEVTYAWLSGYENGIHAVLWSSIKK